MVLEFSWRVWERYSNAKCIEIEANFKMEQVITFEKDEELKCNKIHHCSVMGIVTFIWAHIFGDFSS